MRARTFIWLFWLSAAAAVLALVLPVRIVLMPSWTARVPLPDFPVPGRAYVSAYRGGEVDHYLFRFGLFGFGDRIRNADVLILGSSHPQLALSAAQIAGALVLPGDRPVAAFNMAIGYGEGSAFAREILKANDVTGSTIVIDLFAPYGDGISPYGQIVLTLGAAQAYQRVAQMWAVFLRDWLTDPLLIRVRFTVADGLSFERAMYRVLTRDWNNGDVIDLWNPQMGSRYRNPAPDFLHPLLLAPPQPDAISIPRAMTDFFIERAMTAYAVLIPYPEGNPQVGAARAAAAGIPFVDISSWELEYYDRDHVTAAGRDLATARFIEGYAKLTAEPPALSR